MGHGVGNRPRELVVQDTKIVQPKELVKHVGNRSRELVVGEMDRLEVHEVGQRTDRTGEVVFAEVQVHCYCLFSCQSCQ